MTTTPSGSDALAAFGWSPRIAHHLTRLGPDEHLGRIVRVDRGLCLVATAGGVVRGRFPPDTPVVTGDWVAAASSTDGFVDVVAVLPRSTEIRRLNATASGEQVLVANVDTLFALHGFDRPHRVGRLQRLCILAWETGVHPVIVLTKRDLLDTGDAVITLRGAVAEIAEMLPGVEVHAVSSVTGEGIDALDRHLTQGATVGFAGESGSGKSTLVNRLLGEDRQTTGRTRRGDNKGRHTTTWRELVPLPTGAVVVDMPGVRMVAMAGEETGLATAYEDIEMLAAACRFRDCAHRSEPGCAVRGALADGSLTTARWASYRKLEREMAHEVRRAAERARRNESRGARRRRRRLPEPDYD